MSIRKRTLSRRRFLGEASCAAVGSAPVLSTILNLEMAGRAAAAVGTGSGSRRTLVCLFLSGGCDTFNLLFPISPQSAYDEYVAARSNLALPLTGPAPQNLGYTDAQGRQFGLHYNCPNMKQLFDAGTLSFVANIGTLVEPITSKAEYESGVKQLPKALFSHRDQIEQWQTSIPQGSANALSGWAGRAADILHSTLNTEQTGGFYMPMNFSLSGNSVFQTGVSEGQFVITRNGALSLTAADDGQPTTHILNVKNAAMNDLMSPLEEHYQNIFNRTFAEITRNSMDRAEDFQTHYDAPGSVNGHDIEAAISAAGFNSDSLANNLRAAVRTIAVRDKLKLCRQTLFVEYGGWDHHGELLTNQAAMLASLDRNLFAFQTALETLELQDDVITFSSSDFGRTLRSNGNGTDHAWAGNQFVLGGPIDGGKILGQYPSLVIDGDDDIGRGGRIFPRTSVDQYFCELLRWFGVSNGDMDQVLPNIRNFFDPASASDPIGFLS